MAAYNKWQHSHVFIKQGLWFSWVRTNVKLNETYNEWHRVTSKADDFIWGPPGLTRSGDYDKLKITQETIILECTSVLLKTKR